MSVDMIINGNIKLILKSHTMDRDKGDGFINSLELCRESCGIIKTELYAWTWGKETLVLKESSV